MLLNVTSVHNTILFHNKPQYCNYYISLMALESLDLQYIYLVRFVYRSIRFSTFAQQSFSITLSERSSQS